MSLYIRSASLTSTSFRIVRDKSDIPALITLAREAHEESRFSYIPFSANKVRQIVEMAINDTKRHGLFIAEQNRQTVGSAYCSIGEYHIGEGKLIATIQNINVSQSVRNSLAGGRAAIGLFNGVQSWAKARGACELLLHVTSGIDLARTHKLAKHLGYNTIGASYAKSLG